MPSSAALNTTPNERPIFEIAVEDVEYVRHDGKPLLARLYKPQGLGPFPAMIDLHGGAWCNGDRLNDARLNEAMARAGILVAALDFRMPPDAGYPASIADVNFATRWLKAQATSLAIDPGRVGLIGISSGGHQAMLSAMRPRDSRYAAIRGADGLDARVGCVVLCWPVIDPLGRYKYGKQLQAKGGSYPEQIDRVIPSHDKYWGSEAAMAEGSPVAALEAGEIVEMPPVLYVQGEDDVMHPRPHLDRFVEQYRRRGGEVSLALYAGEVEGFILRNADAPAAGLATERIISFVHRTLG